VTGTASHWHQYKSNWYCFSEYCLFPKDLSNQGVPDTKKQILLFQQSLCQLNI